MRVDKDFVSFFLATSLRYRGSSSSLRGAGHLRHGVVHVPSRLSGKVQLPVGVVQGVTMPLERRGSIVHGLLIAGHGIQSGTVRVVEIEYRLLKSLRTLLLRVQLLLHCHGLRP